ncbi:hypothetical protein [Roseibium aggregatum]|uniref:Uncharacterized protein n=1 Tax=Roseibium aggregatum TaxID=187304 RepID=A0A926NTB6_9HYPH|nr:hypothetical protein [Roseibium aggregatum]MBD1544829.1 hypothetical protein [Roseibium aggregatum]
MCIFRTRLFRADGCRQPRLTDQAQWEKDPLSHPVLARMTPHELADLPFDRPE